MKTIKHILFLLLLTGTGLLGQITYPSAMFPSAADQTGNACQGGSAYGLYVFTASPQKILVCSSGTSGTPGVWQVISGGGGGSGTVTSVGLSLPNIFNITVSPVTTAGTLTATLASQTANLGFFAPNGSNGAPTFRAAVGNDLIGPAALTNRLRTGMNLVGYGDSRMAGFLLPTPATDNWLFQLSNLSSYSGRATYNNFAQTGAGITWLSDNYAAGPHTKSPAVTGIPADLLFEAGINNLDGGNFVSGATITNPGTLYPDGPVTCSIAFVSLPPYGATCTATASGGVVTNVTITRGGEGYQGAAPAITLGGTTGTQATATALVTKADGPYTWGLLQTFLTNVVAPDGWTRVIVGTVPTSLLNQKDTVQSGALLYYNNKIRQLPAMGLASFIVDDARNLQDPFDTAYWQPDALHVNLTGQTMQAQYWNAAIWGAGNNLGSQGPTQSNAVTTLTGTNNYFCDVLNGWQVTTGTNNTICGKYSATTMIANANSTIFGALNFNFGFATTQNSTGGTVSIFGENNANGMSGGGVVQILGVGNMNTATTPFNISLIGQSSFTGMTTANHVVGMGVGVGNGCTNCTNSGVFGDGGNLGASVNHAFQIDSGTNTRNFTLQFGGVTIQDVNVPTITSGFGTGPSIAGHNLAFRVTVGTGGTDTTGLVTFGTTTYTLAPACQANDETTLLPLQATASTTGVTVTAATAFTAADKITVTCSPL